MTYWNIGHDLGHLPIATCCDEGASVNHAHPETGVTALMAASALNQVDTCLHLLRLGADRSLTTLGISALDFALGLGAEETAEALASWGSNALEDTVHVVSKSETDQ